MQADYRIKYEIYLPVIQIEATKIIGEGLSPLEKI
jgi:hypothetical protein